MFKVERRSLRILLILLSIGVIVMSLTSCSSDKSDESSKDNDTSLLVRNKTTNTDKVSVEGLLSFPKSEAGAAAFAFKVASVFVSTDVVQKNVFEKVLSDDSDFSVSAAIQRNTSDTESKIRFSPVGIAIDQYANGKASVAVVGLSFETGNQTTASWKEIHMNLVYKESWGVSDFGIGVINGPITDGQALDPEFLAAWSGYIFPQDELTVGQKTIIAP